jgi:hypothetical protein
MNFGVVTGATSGLIVLDVDPAKGGDESLRDLERVYGPLPETVVVLTGGGGRHVFFQHPGMRVRNSVGTLGPGLDVRGDGGFVVGVGSRHRSGRPYAFEVTADPDTVAVAAVPPWLLERPQTRAADRLRADGTPLVLREGERNQRLFQHGSALRRHGLDETAIRECLEVVNRRHATPPLEADEVARIAASAARYTPVPPPAKAPPAAGDDRDAVDWTGTTHERRALLEAARPENTPAPTDGVLLVPARTIIAEPVHWAWQDRIPLAMLTLVVGPPGLGKSTLTLDLAAGSPVESSRARCGVPLCRWRSRPPRTRFRPSCAPGSTPPAPTSIASS